MNGEVYYPNAFSAQGGSSVHQTLSFSNQNGVTFTNTNGQVGIAHALQFTSNTSAITSAALHTSSPRINVSAGTTSNNLSAVTFGNSNGVSFGLNGSVITGSHNAITTARASNDAVGLNTAVTAGPLALTINSSGFSLNASSAAGTTSGFAGNQISGSMTHNTAGLNLSLNHPAWLTTAMQSNAATISNIRVSAGTTSNLLSAVTFGDANGVSFGLNGSSITASHNGLTTAALSNHSHNFATTTTNGSVIVVATTNSAGATIAVPPFLTTAQAPGAYLTTARASNDAIGLNTAQTNVTWTVNSSGLSLNAAGYAGTGTTFGGTNVSASITLNSAGLNLSLSGQGGGVINQTGPNIAAGTQTATSGTVVFSNSNNITFGMSNSSVVTASFDPINIGISNLGNTGGTSGTFDGAGLRYVFIGEDGIRLSQSSNGSSVSLTIDRMPVNTYIPYYPASTGAQTIGAQGATSASAWFFPVSVQAPVNMNQIEQLMTASWVTSNAAYSQTVTHGFGIFTNNAGTLSLISSSSFSFAITGSSVSATLSYPSAYGTAGGYTYTTVAATTTAQAQSLFGTAGNRIFTLGFGGTMSLSEGLYWLGYHQRQTTAGANGGMAFALAGNVMAAAQNAGPMGQSTANWTGTANTAFKSPWGVATSTGSAGYGGSVLPSAVNITAMGMTATVMPMMTFISR